MRKYVKSSHTFMSHPSPCKNLKFVASNFGAIVFTTYLEKFTEKPFGYYTPFVRNNKKSIYWVQLCPHYVQWSHDQWFIINFGESRLLIFSMNLVDIDLNGFIYTWKDSNKPKITLNQTYLVYILIWKLDCSRDHVTHCEYVWILLLYIATFYNFAKPICTPLCCKLAKTVQNLKDVEFKCWTKTRLCITVHRQTQTLLLLP